MAQHWKIQVDSLEETEKAKDVFVRFDRGKLIVRLGSSHQVQGKDRIFEMYSKVLPYCYGEHWEKDLKQGFDSFTVDRAKQAIFWENKDGERLYIYPQKNVEGNVHVFLTWIE